MSLLGRSFCNVSITSRSSRVLFFSAWICTVLTKSPWDTNRRLIKPLSSTGCHCCHIHASPPSFPLEQFRLVYRTLEVGVHVKFSHYRIYFSKGPTLFQEGADDNSLQNTKSAKYTRTFGGYCKYFKQAVGKECFTSV